MNRMLPNALMSFGGQPRFTGGVQHRAPYESELGFFLRNPLVAGMAAEDNRIILNPFSANRPDEQGSVAMNEAARVQMRLNAMLQPRFDLTPEQIDRFGQYGSPDDIRQTIAARIFSGDPSAGTPSPAQVSHVNRLRNYMLGPETPAVNRMLSP